jgi:hypothetical protein
MEPPQPSARAARVHLLHQVFVVLVHAHVGAVHDFDDFTVDIARNHTGFFPFLIERRRRALGVKQLPFGLAPLVQGFLGHFQGDFVNIAIFDFAVFFNGDGHIQEGGNQQQLVGVLDWYASVSLRATLRKTSATPRPWSECAAAPPAIMRMKLRAAMVLAVAPQRPLRVSLPSMPPLGRGRRQGPMAQFLQQMPCMPMAQGFIWAARSKTVSMPSFWARAIISWVPMSMDEATGSASLGPLAAAAFETTFLISAIRGSSSY